MSRRRPGGRRQGGVRATTLVAVVLSAALLLAGAVGLSLSRRADQAVTPTASAPETAPCPPGLLERAAQGVRSDEPGPGGPSPRPAPARVPLLPSSLLTALGPLTPHPGGVISVPGTTLDRVDISSRVTIAADDVHITHSSIHVHDYFAVFVMPGVRGAVLDHVVIDGSGADGAEGSAGVAGPITVTDADIFGVENGVIPGSGTRITRTCIRDLAAPGEAHYDGIQMDGGQSDVRITANVIDLSTVGPTAAVMMDTEFGALTNIDVSGNVLIGGAYTVYLDGRKGAEGAIAPSVSVTGNSLSGGLYADLFCARSAARVAGNTGTAGAATMVGCSP